MNTLTQSFIPVRKFINMSLGGLDNLLGSKNQIVILGYHSISEDGWTYSVKFKDLEEQLFFMLKNFSPVTLGDIEEHVYKGKKLPIPAFAVTFDDGYKDIYKTRNLLKQLKIKPTVFLLADPQRANRKTLANNKPLLTEKEIKDLIKDGWEIGSHTITHEIVSGKSNPNLIEEIAKSKKILEKKFGNIKYFSYPKGRYDQDSINIVKNAGYKLAFAATDEKVTSDSNKFLISRVGVDGTHSFKEFIISFLPLL